jgi:GABA(A) receptor-associated protein
MLSVFNKKKVELDPKKLEEYTRIHRKYPERIPVILQKGNRIAPEIDRNKYLVPKDITFSSFIGVVRQRLKMKPDEALFIMANNSLVTQSELMSSIYNKYKSPEGFLLLEYSLESTFG